MKEVAIKCVDVFTNKAFAGNPAGVIAPADGLTEDAMLRIASGMIMNIIEYAFVTSTEVKNAAFRVRYFTPKKEINVSGHATIATCYSLLEDGKIPLEDGVTTVNFDTRIGNVPVEIYFHKDIDRTTSPPGALTAPLDVNGRRAGLLQKIMMYQAVPALSDAAVPAADIAAVLGIRKADITGTGLPLVIASNDINWLLIPVKSKETLLGMKPDLIKLGILNRQYGIQTNHIFTLDTISPRCAAYSRHFGPAMGWWEDPATAVASGSLGVYLLKYGITSASSMVMEQGKEVDSLAKILVEVERKDGAVSAVRVGGLATTSIIKKVRIANSTVIEV